MPCTTYSHEEFSLATVDGVDALPIDVALAITYDRNGNWQIDYAGCITSWMRTPLYRGRQPVIAWFEDGEPLEAIIKARAVAKYFDHIEEHVMSCVEDDGERGVA